MKTSKQLTALILTTTSILVAACGKKSGNEVDSSVSDTVEAGITALSGLGDDGSNSAVAADNSRTFMDRLLDETFAERTAQATLGCTRTLSGSAGTCTRDVNCTFGAYSWSGDVALTFSNGSSCLNPGISNAGDSVTRIADFLRSGPRGSLKTISSTSAGHTDYLGDVIGGGTTATRTAGGGLSVAVNGVSKVLASASGSSLFDISLKTSSPVSMNHLARNGRVVTDGSLQIIHNLAKYTATHTYKNVVWSNNDCCYPTSGEIDIAFDGSVTGSATVTFNGCGSGLIQNDKGSQLSFSLANCE